MVFVFEVKKHIDLRQFWTLVFTYRPDDRFPDRFNHL